MTYAAWPRTRYFGNTAPLLVAVLFLVLGMAHPHVAGAGFLLAAIPFLFIFVSGVLADSAGDATASACDGMHRRDDGGLREFGAW